MSKSVSSCSTDVTVGTSSEASGRESNTTTTSSRSTNTRVKAIYWGVTSWADGPLEYNGAKMRYMRCVHHKCPETGRLHWHSFIQFKSKLRLSEVKKLIKDDTAHCVRLYKDDTSYLDDGHDSISEPMEFGKRVTQGQRTAIADFGEAIRDGKSDKELFEMDAASYLRYHNCIGKVRALYMPEVKAQYSLDQFTFPRIGEDEWDKHYHFWGPADTGKTQFALAHFKKPLYVRHVDKLADFYGGQYDGIVVDEVNFSHWPISSVINLLNKKDPAHVHIRYTVAVLPAEVKIIFCSNEEFIFYDNSRYSEETVVVQSIHAKVRTICVEDRMY